MDQTNVLLDRMRDHAMTASWAVWDQNDIDFPASPTGLRTDVVLIAGNPGDAAAEPNRTPWMNFHTGTKHGDHFLAAAVRDTEMWGGYMTDFYSQVESKLDKVVRTDAVTTNDAAALVEELKQLGAQDPLIVLIGKDAAKLTKEPHVEAVARAVGVEPANLRWIHVPHYSGSNGATHRGKPDVYRAAFDYALQNPRQEFKRADFHQWLDARGR